jgi:hypothetical protein
MFFFGHSKPRLAKLGLIFFRRDTRTRFTPHASSTQIPYKLLSLLPVNLPSVSI